MRKTTSIELSKGDQFEYQLALSKLKTEIDIRDKKIENLNSKLNNTKEIIEEEKEGLEVYIPKYPIGKAPRSRDKNKGVYF